MKLTITGSSTARYSTWFYVGELRLLFDAGDGVSSALIGRSGRIRHVFLSHADRDHLGGLLQFYQLNAKPGGPVIHYPRDCGSFPALQDFLARFDPGIGPAEWQPIVPGEGIDIGRGYSVHPHRSEHIVAPPEAVKAFGFRVHHSRRALRDEFRGLPGEEIASARRERGDDAVYRSETLPVLGYSGDSPSLDSALWKDVPILLHECTFLDADIAKHRHSHLQQVLDAAATLDLEALVLTHFSTRYSHDEIRERVIAESATRGIRFPIHLLLPGEVQDDLLATPPVFP